MMAWIGRRPRLAVRAMIRAVKVANDEQVRMWECILLTSRAVPATVTGPLRWVPSLEGDRLAGSHVPTWDQNETGLRLRQGRCGVPVIPGFVPVLFTIAFMFLLFPTETLPWRPRTPLTLYRGFTCTLS